MPIEKVRLIPGVNTQKTRTLNEAGYSNSICGRFFSGLFQAIGGWAPITFNTVIGTVRALWGWADLTGNPYLAMGSEQRLMVDIAGIYSDITPVYLTTNNTPNVSTTAGSTAVTIIDAGSSANAGDWVNLTVPIAAGGIVVSGYYLLAGSAGTSITITAATPAVTTVSNGGAVPTFTTTSGSGTVLVTLANHGFVVGSNFNVLSTTVGGLTLVGQFSVATVPTSGTFTITALSAASSSATVSENSGHMQILYLLQSGVVFTLPITGWGLGDFGMGDWGVAGSTGVNQKLRFWSLDNFGQDLIASPRNGAIYYWQPPVAAPAVVLSGTAPTINAAIFVMSQVEMVIAIGSSTGGTQFPLLIRWCDAGDFTDWTPTAANLAGSYQLPTGSYLIAGLAIKLGVLLWTDAGLWSMTYVGLPFVFSFNFVGSGVTVVGAKAAVTVGGLVVWPSAKGFFQYQGAGVQPLECPVWDFFFDNFDTTQPDVVFGWVNSLFNEVFWFFPLASSSTGQLGYVKWNYLENLWDTSGNDTQLQRTAGIDLSPMGYPLSVDPVSGLIMQHEVSPQANGVTINSTMTTGFFDLSEGDDIMKIDMLMPDFKNLSSAGQVLLSLIVKDYAGEGDDMIYGPYPFSNGVEFVTCNVRARQIALQLEFQDPNNSPRLGAIRYRGQPDGKR